MRYNAREKIAEAYAGAWDKPAQKLLPLPAPSPEIETNESEDDEIAYTPEQQKYIDWLEGYNEDLGEQLRKARTTMRMYAGMYESERGVRKRQSDMSGYWHDLYEDLMLRILNLENTDEMMKAHNAFKKRISNR